MRCEITNKDLSHSIFHLFQKFRLALLMLLKIHLFFCSKFLDFSSRDYSLFSHCLNLHIFFFFWLELEISIQEKIAFLCFFHRENMNLEASRCMHIWRLKFSQIYSRYLAFTIKITTLEINIIYYSPRTQTWELSKPSRYLLFKFRTFWQQIELFHLSFCRIREGCLNFFWDPST